MTSTATARTEFRLGQRSSRRVWVFASVAGTGAIVLLLVWLLTYRPALGTYRLTDGTRLVLSSITYGKVHRSDDRSALMRLADSLSGRKLPREVVVQTDKESPVAWVRVAERGRAWNGLSHPRVVDSHGCSLGDLQPERFRNEAGDTFLYGVPFEHLPYGGGRVRLEIPYSGQTVGTLFCETAPIRSVSTLVPKVLPQRARAGDVFVLLEGVTRDTGYWAYESHGAKLEIDAEEDSGNWSAGWFVLTDSSGRRFANVAGWRPTDVPEKTQFQAPCWKDVAWKMEVGVAPSLGTSVQGDRTWTLNAVVPPVGSEGRFRVVSGPIVLEFELERSGYVMASKTRFAPQMSLRVKIMGWKEGGRLILDRVNGERFVKRLQRWAIVGHPYRERCSVIEVLPGKETEGRFSIPLDEGEKALNLRISGHHYRVAEFAFDPSKALLKSDER